MTPLIKTNAWKALDDHAHLLYKHNELFQQKNRAAFHAKACSLHLNYSHQHITTDTLLLLFSLAKACRLQEKIQALMQGDPLNFSENKPALHTALRATKNTSIFVNHHDVMPDVIATRHKMQAIIEKIRTKQWLGFSGQPITDLVNIGIGGSDLGPRFCLNALSEWVEPSFGYHFISDADPLGFDRIIAKLKPETTLFIVSSKSFTTQETRYNAQKAMQWIGSEAYHPHHFIAVTAHPERARQIGIHTILPIWDWVGGRYSFCSAINLITAIAIGYPAFEQILTGANQMDQHVQHSELAENLPILMALMGIWNNNFLNIHNLLMLTYSQQLDYFVPYIQQLDMESNGKSIDNQGNPVQHATGPLVWGGLGNQAQHSYYQLLCQGTHRVTADFISIDTLNDHMINTMCHNKINVLTKGIPANEHHPNAHIPGNLPLNHLRLKNISPLVIGSLIALYEHKIFIQSVVWDINPFDQPGIEAAKRIYLNPKNGLDRRSDHRIPAASTAGPMDPATKLDPGLRREFDGFGNDQNGGQGLKNAVES